MHAVFRFGDYEIDEGIGFHWSETKEDYPKPSVAVDLVVVAPDGDGRPRVLLIKRGRVPQKGLWALPGGFLNLDETGEQAALRELHEETGLILQPDDIEFLKVSDAVDRDPRGRVIGLSYLCLLPSLLPLKAGDDASDAHWHRLNSVDHFFNIAFDHYQILLAAIDRMEQIED